jgi:hypothetical protein
VWKNTINNSWFLFHFKSHKQIPRNLATYCKFIFFLEKKDVSWKKVTYLPLLSYSLDGLPLKFFFFVCFVFLWKWAILIGPSPKQLKLERLLRITTSMWGWSAYMWEGESFGQRIWDKVRCYWEHPWGTIVNLRNIMGNMMGTQE